MFPKIPSLKLQMLKLIQKALLNTTTETVATAETADEAAATTETVASAEST